MSDSWYLLSGVAILLLLSSYLLIKWRATVSKNKKLQLRIEDLQKHSVPLSLKAVESKLNPHLFKNILNSIQSHAYQTYFALDKLANVLDYILYDSQKKFVTPKDEIQFALNLIEINKIKLSPLFELKVKLKVNETETLYATEVIAPLISIDLIENAFKHADLQSADSFISITFEFRNGIFSLTVSNKISTVTPIHRERGGIGSETMEQRLKLIYNGTFKLEKFVEGDTFIAHLKIDLNEYQAKMHTAG